MKLDDAAKGASIVSVLLTAGIAVAGFVASRQLSALDARLKSIEMAKGSLDLQKRAYDASARLLTEFSVPLARSFALTFVDSTTGRPRSHVYFATAALRGELLADMEGWRRRRGLMVGRACADNGLEARQVVTLVVRNIGVADADDVRLVVAEHRSPQPAPNVAWRLTTGTASAGYTDLRPEGDGWRVDTLPLEPLRGASSPEDARDPALVALASVAGTRSLYGTVVVPVALLWTDAMTGRPGSVPVMRTSRGRLDADLVGAEIGTLSAAACR